MIAIDYFDGTSPTLVPARSVAELRRLASGSGIGIGVVDLDLVTVPEIARLREQFAIEIVCKHHARRCYVDCSMGAGTVDCCFVGEGARHLPSHSEEHGGVTVP
jgi:hypothetical protein